MYKLFGLFKKAQNNQKTKSPDKTRSSIDEDALNNELLSARSICEYLAERRKQTDHLYKIIYALCAMLVFCVVLMFSLGSQSKVIPYIVKVSGNNQIISVDNASAINYASIKPYLATYMLEEFVKSARSVTFDGNFQKELLEKAYAYTQGQATSLLKSFVEARAPFALAKKETISVSINNVLERVGGSDNTTQIKWIERAQDPEDASTLWVKHFTGLFSFKWDQPPQDVGILRLNPLGLYITHVTWTQDLD